MRNVFFLVFLCIPHLCVGYQLASTASEIKAKVNEEIISTQNPLQAGRSLRALQATSTEYRAFINSEFIPILERMSKEYNISLALSGLFLGIQNAIAYANLHPNEFTLADADTAALYFDNSQQSKTIFKVILAHVALPEPPEMKNPQNNHYYRVSLDRKLMERYAEFASSKIIMDDVIAYTIVDGSVVALREPNTSTKYLEVNTKKVALPHIYFRTTARAVGRRFYGTYISPQNQQRYFVIMLNTYGGFESIVTFA